MKKLHLLSILLTFTLSALAKDPFDQKITITKGKFKGSTLNVSSGRPVVILDETSASMTVANIRHQNKFWKGIIPKNSVAKLIIQIIDFPTGIPLVKAAHTQVRVILKDGAFVQLHSQDDDASKADCAFIKDFVISVEAGTPIGEKYNLVEGLSGNYVLITRMVSTENRVAEDSSLSISQYDLRMSEREMAHYLEVALKTGSDLGYSAMYYTIEKNCTTDLFESIDQVMSYRHAVKPFAVSLLQILDPIAGPTVKAMKERELIDNQSNLPLMGQQIDQVVREQQSFNKSLQCGKM